MERPQRERRGTRKAEAVQDGKERRPAKSARKAVEQDANKENTTPDILTPRRGRAVKFTYPHESPEFAHTQTGAFTVVGPACFSHEGALFSGNMKNLDDLLDHNVKQDRKVYQLIARRLAAEHTHRWDLQPYLPKGEPISLPARRKAVKLLRDYEYESSDEEDDEMIDASLDAQGTEKRVAAAIVHNKHRLRVLKANLAAALAPCDTSLVRMSSQKQTRGPKKCSATELVRARTDSEAPEVKASRTDSKSPIVEPRPAARQARNLQIDMVNAPSFRDASAPRYMRSQCTATDEQDFSRRLSVATSSPSFSGQMTEPAASPRRAADCVRRPKRSSRPTEKVRLGRSASPPEPNSHKPSTKPDCDVPEPITQENRLSRIVVLAFKSMQAQAKFGELVNSRASFPAVAAAMSSLAYGQVKAKSLNTLGRPMSPSAASGRSEMSSGPKGTKRELEASPDVDVDEHSKKRLRLNVRPPVRESATGGAPPKKMKLILRCGADKVTIADRRATTEPAYF
nr:hypothetical protein B0A51_10773 [Rachicladosporium sp. CCFEE 5018]